MITTRFDAPVISDAKDEIRFEILRGLTRTARDASLAIKEEMPRKFILRRNWVTKGIRFDPATRADPVARVYSVDPYMLKQEEGELYQAEGFVAIPAGVRRKANEAIPWRMLPKALKGRRDIVKADLGGRAGWVLFQRTPSTLKILYFLRKSKRTKARWEFAETVEKVLDRRFLSNLL